MNRLECTEYVADLDIVCNLALPWNDLKGKTIVVSGATGMIGAFFIDVLMRKNETTGLGCNVVALGRSVEKARLRLPYFESCHFLFKESSIASTGYRPVCSADYVLHLASSTHPRQYSSDPIGTIRANVDGLQIAFCFIR